VPGRHHHRGFDQRDDADSGLSRQDFSDSFATTRDDRIAVGRYCIAFDPTQSKVAPVRSTFA
jgi:hypothetical protein